MSARRLRLSAAVGACALCAFGFFLFTRGEPSAHGATTTPPPYTIFAQVIEGTTKFAIPVGAYSVGFQRPTTTGGRPGFQVTLRRPTDAGTQKLILAMAQGSPLDQVNLFERQNGKPYMSYAMKQVVITRLMTKGRQGSIRPHDTDIELRAGAVSLKLPGAKPAPDTLTSPSFDLRPGQVDSSPAGQDLLEWGVTNTEP